MSRRKPKNIGSNDVHNTSISPCIICLDEVRCRGKITVCDHWFCFGCIVEWSKNTNTCPICKARFRTISKVHLSPLKSPTTKVRVPDKDQRVWNDDDDIALQDLIDDLQNDLRDEIDSDYEPPTYVNSTLSQARSRLSVHNYQYQGLDDYDLEDSFIDDSNISQVLSFEEHFYLEVERRPIHRNSFSIIEDESDDYIDSDDDLDEDSFYDDDDDDDDYSDSESEDSDDWSIQDLTTSARASHRSVTSRLRSSKPSSSRSSKTSRSPPSRRDSKAPQTSQSRRESTSSKASRSTKPSKTKPAKKTKKNSTARETKSKSRHQKEQAANKQKMKSDVIAKSIQETGSSGWLTTSRRPGRAAAELAARQLAQSQHSSPEKRKSDRRRNTTRRRGEQGTHYKIPSDISDESTDDDVQIISTICSGTRGLSRRGQHRSKTVSYVYDSDSDDQLPTERQHDQHHFEIASTSARSLQPIENKTDTKGEGGKRKKWSGKGKENCGNNDTHQAAKRKRTRLLQKKIDDYDTAAQQTGQEVGQRKSPRGKNQRQSYYNYYPAGPSTSLIDSSQSDDDYDDNVSSNVTNGRKCFIIDNEVDNETDDESATVVLPTPQDKKKRSMFTKRQHKPMLKTFYEDSDAEQERNSTTQMMHTKQDLVPKNNSKKCSVANGKGKKTRRRIKVYDSDSD